MIDLDSRFDIEKADYLSRRLKQELNHTSKDIFTEFEHTLLPYIQAYNQLAASIARVASLIVVDRQGEVRYVDDSFCDLTCYKRDELVGFSYRHLLADGRQMMIDWPRIQQGEVIERELDFQVKEGQPLWLRTTMIPLTNQDDEVTSVIIYGRNLSTSERQKHSLLEDMKSDFSRTVDALVNLVFKVIYSPQDQQFYYTMFEGKLAHEIGLTTKVVQGKNLQEIFGEVKGSFYFEKYLRAYRGEYISYKHKYKGRYFYTTLSPVEENGQVIEVIGSSVEITSYEEAELRIQYMASHDPLTDLPNRAKLQKDLKNILYKSTGGEQVTIMLFNLDRFKYVNDALGHISGDQVLQLMAKRINSCLQLEDRLYRLGGDEFVVCLKGNKSKDDLIQMGKHILQKIGEPMDLMDKQFFITASIGAAQYPESAGSEEELIANAGIAMHYSKIKGRQNLLFYTPKMNQYYNRMISMEGDLREAISRNELSLHFQPKVSVETGFLSGMEALVRWEHPEHGRISPGEFIPLAEETGLIAQVDEWVLYEACRQNQRWIEQGYAPERIAVNVSANEFQQRGFAAKVAAVLKETNLEPQYLEIEVTENSVMQNTEDCIRAMQDLKALGVSLSIDDFGTGYSSLSYLRQFPIHYLKIDQAFIKDVLKDPSDAEIVKAMIQLAEAFKLEVVAEGVEDEEVLEFLRENRCAYYQGYHYSKPLPPDEMEHLLVEKQSYY